MTSFSVLVIVFLFIRLKSQRKYAKNALLLNSKNFIGIHKAQLDMEPRLKVDNLFQCHCYCMKITLVIVLMKILTGLFKIHSAIEQQLK